jgi:hypothetical protein
VPARIHPIIVQFASNLVPRVHSSYPVRCLDAHGLPETTEYPESLCLVWALSTTRMTFKVISEDITLLSWLIRTHAPDRIPPNISVFPCMLGLCRLSPVPAGKRPFPTLSPQSLYRCKDPYPATSLRCPCPFLPEGLRSHLGSERFDTSIIRRNATSTTGDISGLQSFHNVQAPILARPSGCTHHWTSKYPRQPGRLHHALLGWLPIPRCGITTCLNRAIGTAGLSPAGLRPCRPLPLLIPLHLTARPFKCPGLAGLDGHYPIYTFTMTWSDCRTAILPPCLFSLLEASIGSDTALPRSDVNS